MRLSIVWLRRLAGLALFAIGIAYWIRLVGVFPAANWRFDLMSAQWRAASCVLAVLAPVGGVGLWLAASWGTVVWVIVAAMEAGMHFVLPQVFGEPDIELAVVVVGLVVFALLRIAEWWTKRPPVRAD